MQSATPEGRGGIGWGELGLEPAALDPAAERDLNGVRVILVASDPTTTDALAQQLRAHGAFVGVVDARGGGLARLAFLDPQVILAGRGEVGDAFRAVLGESPRLRFAPILQIDWGGVWPPDAARPDLGALGQLVRPHASLDAALARKAREEAGFRVPFERIGPARVLRALAGPSEDVLHLMLRAGEVRAIVEVCGDLVVGATWYGAGGERHVGARALAAVLGLRRAEAHVERRALARALTIMAPVGLALDAAEALRPSLPPPGTGMAPRGQGLDTLEHDLKGLARASARAPDSAAITAPVRLPEATAKHMTFALGDDEVTAKGPAAEVALGDELADWEDTTTEGPGAGEGWDEPTAEEAPGWGEPTDRHPSVPPAVLSEARVAAAVSKAGPPPPPPPPPPSAAARAARPKASPAAFASGGVDEEGFPELTLESPGPREASGERARVSHAPPPDSSPVDASASTSPPDSSPVDASAITSPPDSSPVDVSAPAPLSAGAASASASPEGFVGPPRASAAPRPAPSRGVGSADRAGAHPKAESRVSRARWAGPIVLAVGALGAVGWLIYGELTGAAAESMMASPERGASAAAAGGTRVHPSGVGAPGMESVEEPAARVDDGVDGLRAEEGGGPVEGPSAAAEDAPDEGWGVEPSVALVDAPDAEEGAAPDEGLNAGMAAPAGEEAQAADSSEEGAAREEGSQVAAGAEAASEEDDGLSVPPAPSVFGPGDVDGGRDRPLSDRYVELARRRDGAARIAALHAAASADETNPHAAAGLAQLFLEARALGEAEAWAERAVRLRRRRGRYHLLLGDVRAARGDDAGARRAWEAAEELGERAASERLR